MSLEFRDSRLGGVEGKMRTLLFSTPDVNMSTASLIVLDSEPCLAIGGLRANWLTLNIAEPADRRLFGLEPTLLKPANALFIAWL